MEHTLETLRKVLNRYLNPDPATGLIPMTPMHVEINAIEAEFIKIRESPKNLSLDEGHDVVPDLIKDFLEKKTP